MFSADCSTVGIFGMDSVTWKMDREAFLFLAAGRASLLQVSRRCAGANSSLFRRVHTSSDSALIPQLAHPFVASAIKNHSQIGYGVQERFYLTFRYVFRMVFGDRETAISAARTVCRHEMAGKTE